MSNRAKPVMGVHAPPPKPTAAGAFWLALVVTLPLAVLYGAVHLLRWLWF
ncbi:hypothetical protein [Rhodovulum sp. ES.010]|nr:hypothetical protein [Rhodovulum sp. ES.010]